MFSVRSKTDRTKGSIHTVQTIHVAFTFVGICVDFALNKETCLEKWPKPWWPLFFFILSNSIIFFIGTSHPPNCISSTPLSTIHNKEQLAKHKKKERKKEKKSTRVGYIDVGTNNNTTNHNDCCCWCTFEFGFSYGRNRNEKKEVCLNMLCYGREEREGKKFGRKNGKEAISF